jgi:citrate lyase subunit beta/citryl-CoA lyase
MRSILLVSSDSRPALKAALASEADGLAIDLAWANEAQAEGARKNAAAWIAEARARDKRSLALVHPLGSGLADRDLDAVMPAQPDGIILPEACGGRDVQHLGAKLAVREAECGLPDGSTHILALAADTPAAIFELGSFARATRRLIGLGRNERALMERLGIFSAPGPRPEPLGVARALCLFAASAASAPGYDCAEPGEGEDFVAACQQAAHDGFAGKFVLNAAQAKIVNAAFTKKG